jgi:hypothetical protein
MALVSNGYPGHLQFYDLTTEAFLDSQEVYTCVLHVYRTGDDEKMLHILYDDLRNSMIEPQYST